MIKLMVQAQAAGYPFRATLATPATGGFSISMSPKIQCGPGVMLVLPLHGPQTWSPLSDAILILIVNCLGHCNNFLTGFSASSLDLLPACPPYCRQIFFLNHRYDGTSYLLEILYWVPLALKRKSTLPSMVFKVFTISWIFLHDLCLPPTSSLSSTPNILIYL